MNFGRIYITRSVFAGLVLLLFAMTGVGQDLSKPWVEWSKKDAEKVLNDSPWGQTFFLDASETSDVTVITPNTANINSRGESGQSRPSRSLKYRARFLTAKPIREAFARMILLSQPNAESELKSQLQGFIERDFGDYLVIALSIESEDPRVATSAMAGLGKLNAAMLRGKIVLERKDGKQATFIDYKVPVEDGMGAKFVFSRTLDGRPFLSDADDNVKLSLQLSDKKKISMKFKVSGMTYNNKLEY